MSARNVELSPVVINEVLPVGEQPRRIIEVFSTGSLNKRREIERILGHEVTITGRSITEIQGTPDQVTEQKAKDAYFLNKGPAIVEETALDFTAFPGIAAYPAAYADDRGNLEKICRMLGPDEREAAFEVRLAIWDGKEPQMHKARKTGKIANHPQGSNGFAFDTIFIPDNQIDAHGNPVPQEHWKTYAEMTDAEKDLNSPRRDVLLQLAEEPFVYKDRVFQLPEPYRFQVEAIRAERLAQEQLLRHAYDLEALEGNEPQADFSIQSFPPFYRFTFGNGEFTRIVTPEDSPSIGMILTPMDTATALYGEPYRLKTNDIGEVTLWQMGPEAVRMALASRAYELKLHHNEEMYSMLREMMAGNPDFLTPERANAASPAFEELLKIARRYPQAFDKHMDDDQDGDQEIPDDVIQELYREIVGSMASNEIGYARQYSDEPMSRTKAANRGLITTASGIASSLFHLGAMPPVTGHADVLATAAASYMPSYTPRNNYILGSEKQLRLVRKAFEKVEAIKAPDDITDLMKRQIGVAVGCESPKAVVEQFAPLFEAGVRRVRIYSTNLDYRVIETAERFRDKYKEDIIITIGPIGDYQQARKLIGENIQANILLAGHGGGENCTSLEGGGAANALELLYLMQRDPAFNKTAIGLEGGTGNYIGALLGMVDVISLNRRGVNGGIETGNLFVEHVNGRVGQPYHGSASPITQHIEAALDPAVAERRLNDAGMLYNVEGVPNYMFKPRSVVSIVNRFQEARMYAGRALADQRAGSIAALRTIVKNEGFTNHRVVSASAGMRASHHRGTQ